MASTHWWISPPPGRTLSPERCPCLRSRWRQWRRQLPNPRKQSPERSAHHLLDAQPKVGLFSEMLVKFDSSVCVFAPFAWHGCRLFKCTVVWSQMKRGPKLMWVMWYWRYFPLLLGSFQVYNCLTFMLQLNVKTNPHMVERGLSCKSVKKKNNFVIVCTALSVPQDGRQTSQTAELRHPSQWVTESDCHRSALFDTFLCLLKEKSSIAYTVHCSKWNASFFVFTFGVQVKSARQK